VERFVLFRNGKKKKKKKVYFRIKMYSVVIIEREKEKKLLKQLVILCVFERYDYNKKIIKDYK
jgi:hypothetical protein